LLSKNKFDKETLNVYVTNNSISDNVFGENKTLAVLLAASGFDTKTLKIIYRLTESQLSVLSLINMKDLQKHCSLDISMLKQLTPYNLTAALVGIQNLNATCKATESYVAAKNKTVSVHEAKCREIMNTEIVLTKALSKAITVSAMGSQNVLQLLTTMCSDVSISNMSVIMGWGPANMTVLGNYTMEDAALCKRMPVRSVVSRTLMDLVKMILKEVHKCVIIPCRSGTVLNYETYNCTGMNLTTDLFIVTQGFRTDCMGPRFAFSTMRPNKQTNCFT
jgi:hypothetical protein